MKNKVAVIVLDGLCFKVLDILFRKGCMPYLNELSKEGTNLELQTDIPLTGSSWAAMISGKKPFESGFNDARSINSRYQICRRSLAVKTVWHILNDNNNSVGIFNAPYVGSVYKVNGFLVAGKGGPTKNSDFTYPYSVKKEIFKIWGGKEKYSKDINKLKYRGNPKGLIERVRFVNNSNSKACKSLISKYNPDVFIGFFTETDKLFHVVFDDLMALEKEDIGSISTGSSLIDLFNTIDENIKNIFSTMGDNVEKIIVSDHGFGELDYRFKLEKWLVDNNYLYFNQPPLNSQKVSLKKIMGNIIPSTIINYFRRNSYRSTFNDKGYTERVAEPIPNILWHKSKAFSITGNSLYINDSRFQNGVINSEEQYLNLRDEIIKKLSKLRLPDGRNPFPDIVIKPKNSCFSSDGPDISINSNIVSCERPSYNVQSDSDGSYFVATKKGDSGSHRRNSVFIGNGRFFTKLHANKIFEHADLPALILYLASVEPDDMPEDLLTFLQRSKGVIT